MTYLLLNLPFLAMTAVVTLLTASRPGFGRRMTASAIAAAVLIALTAVFDNVMIGIGLVGYDASRISGVFVGIAPLEDFAYAVAALVLLPSVWVLLGGPKVPRVPAASTPPKQTAKEARS